MAQDFAKGKRGNTRSETSIPGWVWFVSGLAAGAFVTFLFFVQRDLAPDPEVDALVNTPSAEIVAPPSDDKEWNFYDIFPKSEVPLVDGYESPAPSSAAQPAAAHSYLLQAGSFRKADDADALRAELILLGMNAFVRRIENDGNTWHRVLVGPIESDLELTRQRRKLAEANIASIALRVTP